MSIEIERKIKELESILLADKIDGYVSNWKDVRLYINLASCNRGWAGDRNHKLYYDLRLDKLVNQAGKGFLSPQFSSDVKRLDYLVR